MLRWGAAAYALLGLPNGLRLSGKLDEFITSDHTPGGPGPEFWQIFLRHGEHRGELRLTKTGSTGCTFEITLPI